MNPSMASAAFTGMGFDSMKLTCIRSKSRSWMARASANAPRLAAATSAVISAGTTLDATEITPRPPTAITGSAIASSPLSTRKSSGMRAQTSAICIMLPDASFTPMMPGIVASRCNVGTSMFVPARPGTL